MTKLSIIVPAYNIENYLGRCLDSILEQTYTDYECILVDDGSIDGTKEICDEYAKKDSRIIVIHQENGGLSSARNKALGVANGELVMFVDGDDYLMPMFAERMIELIDVQDADIAKCDYYKGYIDAEEFPIEVSCYDGQEFTRKILTDEIGSQLWQYIFKRQLWQGIVSPRGRQAQDMMILHEVTHRAKKIVVTNERLYFYFIDRADSTSNLPAKKAKGAFDRAVAFMIKYQFARRIGCEDILPQLIDKTIHFCNNGLVLKSPQSKDFDGDIAMLREFLKAERKTVQRLDLKSKILSGLIVYLPRIYCAIRNKK